MSAAAYVLAAVLTIAVAGAVAHRLRHASRTVDAALAGPALIELLPAAPDNRAGLDVEAQDECELLWSLPAHLGNDLEAGIDRLRQAIRDEQHKGDQ